MGLTYANIEVINLSDITLNELNYIGTDQIRRVNIRVLVDSGAMSLCINESIMNQLGLIRKGNVVATLADGSLVELPKCSGVEVRFENRAMITDAIVLPGETEPIMGVIPLEAMDCIIHPATNQLIVNPDHPLRAQVYLK